jgi:hypothetical protein
VTPLKSEIWGEHTFSAAITAAPATVFLRLTFAAGFFASSPSTVSTNGFAGFRVLNAIRLVGFSGGSDPEFEVGGVMID